MPNRASAELTCRELVELITAYLEGALPQGGSARLEHHLACCTGCTSYLQQLQAVIQACPSLQPPLLTAEAERSLLVVFRGWRRR